MVLKNLETLPYSLSDFVFNLEVLFQLYRKYFFQKLVFLKGKSLWVRCNAVLSWRIIWFSGAKALAALGKMHSVRLSVYIDTQHPMAIQKLRRIFMKRNIYIFINNNKEGNFILNASIFSSRTAGGIKLKAVKTHSVRFSIFIYQLYTTIYN